MLFSLPQKPVEQEKLKGGGLVVAASVRLPEDNEIHKVLADVEAFDTVTWFTNGEWSMVELLTGLLLIAGPSDVYISSYGFSDNAARLIADMKSKGIIQKLFCLLDSRINTRSASALNIIRNCSDVHRLVETHAKVTILKSETVEIAVVCSANYTENRRYEAGVIFKQPAVVNYHLNWMVKEIFKDAK